MSFPPRPPIGMPPMAPGMPYAFAPMGMMQMGMGMMPQTTVMRPIVTTAQNTGTTLSINKPKKQLVPQEIPKDDDKEEKPPVTTVFVGNISERAPDAMIRQMLQRCGNVLSWKRVQGASGKLQAFGFCEYESPEATLRCMRLLNEWNICDKKLVVKVDAKTKTLLDEYRKKKRDKLKTPEEKEKEKEAQKEKEAKENGEDDKKEEGEATTPKEDEEDEDDELDEMSQREDRVAKAGLDAIMREYSGDLARAPVQEQEKETKQIQKKKEEKEPIKDTGIDELDMEEDKREIINREIKTFRDLHKGEDEPEKDSEKERERERERRIMEEKRRRDRERAREREREREREMERLERERNERARTRSRSRSRSRERERVRKRERERERSRSRERDRDRDRRMWERERDIEDEEEAHERRKLEKKLREKEAAYQERLKNWEARERKKAREYEKEREREEEKKAEESREARRLKEFLEDYDDERDDPKFYKGSCLIRRLKEREKEGEVDARDRQREKEELEEIRKKLLDEGHPDPEAELAKIERERVEHLKPRLNLKENIPPPAIKSPSEPEILSPERKEPVREEPMEEVKPVKLPPNMKNTLKPVEISSNNTSPTSDEDSNFPPASEDSQQPVYGPTQKEDYSNAKLGFSGLKLGNSAASPTEGNSGKRKKLTVGDVFNQDDDDSSDGAKKRKLVPLDYDDDKSDKKPTTAEEKRARIKHLIESIPTAKDELFAYPLDWNIVDQILMDKRIKPWVNKKIVEYIGEEEPTLTEFICQKVMSKSIPQNILNDVAMVLDEEAEVFVVKMWRLLVYETEAKKLGLVK